MNKPGVCSRGLCAQNSRHCLKHRTSLSLTSSSFAQIKLKKNPSVIGFIELSNSRWLCNILKICSYYFSLHFSYYFVLQFPPITAEISVQVFNFVVPSADAVSHFSI